MLLRIIALQPHPAENGLDPTVDTWVCQRLRRPWRPPASPSQRPKLKPGAVHAWKYQERRDSTAHATSI